MDFYASICPCANACGILLHIISNSHVPANRLAAARLSTSKWSKWRVGEHRGQGFYLTFT